MDLSTQEILWKVIKINMGYNCLASFKYFYKDDPLRVQCKVVMDIFKDAFGETTSREMLQPVLTILEKEGEKV